MQRCPTKDLHKTHGYWDPNHPPNFSTMHPAVPEAWKRGAHVRTCRCNLATLQPCRCNLVESTLLITPNPNPKFEHNRPSHSRDAEARCARAHMQRYTTHDLWKAHSSWPTTHSPNSNTIGQAVPEIQKRGVHVRTCRRRYPAHAFCKMHS